MGGVVIIGTGMAAAATALMAGDELGAAIDAGLDAGARTAAAVLTWANNKKEGIHIRGLGKNIEKHFGYLAGAGGPEKGDPNDPDLRSKWKKDIQRGINEIKKRIEKTKGDRNREPYQKQVEEYQRRLAETP